MRLLSIFLLIVASCLPRTPIWAADTQTATEPSDRSVIALSFIQSLAKGDHAAAAGYFAGNIKGAISPNRNRGVQG